jgi:predicted metal-dependent HD superfamily phosphohydrolase
MERVKAKGDPDTVFDQLVGHYGTYDRQITDEYTTVYPWEAFRVGRARALEEFRKRNPIFQTECFRSCYEEQAKENLASLIERLRS